MEFGGIESLCRGAPAAEAHPVRAPISRLWRKGDYPAAIVTGRSSHGGRQPESQGNGRARFSEGTGAGVGPPGDTMGKHRSSSADAASDLSYSLYTSGSTGRPEGVIHTHSSALSFVDWGSEILQPNAADRFSSHAPRWWTIGP